MGSAETFRTDGIPAFEPANNRPLPEISSVIYSSHATSPLSQAQLQSLLQKARSRNHAESITGLVIYDNGSFFQWLEGPASALQRVMRSINNDQRHTDIKILGATVTRARLFGDWDLKFATGNSALGSLEADAIHTPPGLIETLDRRPETARDLLARLSSMPQRAPMLHIATPADAPKERDGEYAASLRGLVETRILPRLFAKHVRTQAEDLAREIASRGRELARLLVAADPRAAGDLMQAFAPEGARSVVAFSSGLFEAAARGLGDLWDDDVCSGVDVTLGLYRLQLAVRRMGASFLPPVFGHVPAHSVLVSPQPGELHILEAMLDSETLLQAGWNVRSEYPETDEALEKLVAQTYFDVLDLTLSAVFRREDWLPRMAETIAHVRHASRNPELLVLVGGRAFVDSPDSAARVGADAGTATAADLAAVIGARLSPRV